MADFSSGTEFGKFDKNKSMRLSNRDIVLVIGIVVALVVTLTALVYRDKLETAKRRMPAPKKTSMNATANKLIEFFSSKVDSGKF